MTSSQRSMQVVAETVAANRTQPDTTVTGADDLLERFGLRRLYEYATNNPPQDPYAKLKQAIDKRLYKGERWSLADVAQWPVHVAPWREHSKEELGRALRLQPGGYELPEEDKGAYISGKPGVAFPAPSASDGGALSGAVWASGGVGGEAASKQGTKTVKLKVKMKRPRAPDDSPQVSNVTDGSKRQKSGN